MASWRDLFKPWILERGQEYFVPKKGGYDWRVAEALGNAGCLLCVGFLTILGIISRIT